MPRIERTETITGTPIAPVTPMPPITDEPKARPVLSLELSRNQGTAWFYVPTVDDMRIAEKARGAFTGAGYQPEFFRILGKRCLFDWAGSDKAPAEMRAADDQAIIRLFLERITNELPEQAKSAGFDELPEGNQVTLRNDDRLLFRDLTQKDMKQIESLSGGGNIEPNVKLAIATCIEWNGEALKFGELSARFMAMLDVDYFRVVEALNAFL